MSSPSNATANDASTAAVSVVVISDYAVGSEESWSDIRATMKALARQDFDEPVEYLLIESGDQRGKVPEDLVEILPSLRVVFGESDNSYGLKNEAVAAASCEIVAILDADCSPDPDWLRLLVAAMRSSPEVAAVSGRTEYPRTTFSGRAMGLLERSFIESGHNGHTTHITNNGAGFRRSVYLRHPLPTDWGVFASKQQSDAMLRDGHRLLFEPRMRVVHEFDWSFDRDHRRGVGHGAIYMRRRNPALPGGWAARLGYASIPLFVGVRLLKGWWHALRFHDRYGVRWFELPAVLGLAVVGCCREIPGMLSAVRDELPPENRFR